MAAKRTRYPGAENFRRLPDDKDTRQLIDAMLDMRDSVPERAIPDALPPLPSSPSGSSKRPTPGATSG